MSSVNNDRYILNIWKQIIICWYYIHGSPITIYYTNEATRSLNLSKINILTKKELDFNDNLHLLYNIESFTEKNICSFIKEKFLWVGWFLHFILLPFFYNWKHHPNMKVHHTLLYGCRHCEVYITKYFDKWNHLFCSVMMFCYSKYIA